MSNRLNSGSAVMSLGSRPASLSLPPLICLPFAGAGASFFKKWTSLTDSLEIITPQLPGREKRSFEEPYRSVTEAISGMLPEILSLLGGHKKVMIFGHSLGAVLAYELACRLCSRGNVCVEHLIVSGSPGPWTPRQNQATGMDDESFLRQVREFAGYDHPALNDPDMRELLLPVLRADVEMHESYYPADHTPLPVPVTAIRGVEDELVSSEEALEWRTATATSFQLHEIPGGHMYLTETPHTLLKLIANIARQPAAMPVQSAV